MSDLLKVTLWNTEWSKPKSKRGRLVSALLAYGSPDVICVTEGYPDIFPSGYAVCCDEDHGYNTTDGRRKVMLWSRQPWRDVDSGHAFAFPPGRFITAITDTSLGPVRLIGVCVPWKDAHVKTGRADRQQWADHLTYLDALGFYLAALNDDVPSVLLGDFNQRIPRQGQPLHVFEALSNVLRPTFRVVTKGVLPGVDSQSIDHLAIIDPLEVGSVEAFGNLAEDGTELSDHFGIRIHLVQSHFNQDCRRS